MSDNATQNTDRELWREPPGDYYANSIHVTTGGGIGINVGGKVYVKPLKDWHALADERAADPAPAREPEIVARHDHHPLDKLYADPQFQKEYHEELARERAVNPAPAEGALPFRCSVYQEILAERILQDQQWGGSTHDDNHRPDEWCLYIDKQRRLARDADDPRAYESRLIKIAALAVAAIQSSRRLNQPKAPGAAPAEGAPQKLRFGDCECGHAWYGHDGPDHETGPGCVYCECTRSFFTNEAPGAAPAPAPLTREQAENLMFFYNRFNYRLFGRANPSAAFIARLHELGIEVAQ